MRGEREWRKREVVGLRGSQIDVKKRIGAIQIILTIDCLARIAAQNEEEMKRMSYCGTVSTSPVGCHDGMPGG